jgi:hypothetical protein
MPARFALRIALPAVSAALLLTAGLTMQTRASPIHDRVVVAPSAALATGDDRQLVRAADAVFVGRVDAAEPVEMVGSTPYTHFDVTVIDVMKGALAGQVTLAQLGGVVPTRHERVVVSGDSPLETGNVYLFSAQQSAAAGALVVVPGHGHIDLTADVLNPRALTAESARTIPRVARMRSVMDLRPLD